MLCYVMLTHLALTVESDQAPSGQREWCAIRDKEASSAWPWGHADRATRSPCGTPSYERRPKSVRGGPESRL